MKLFYLFTAQCSPQMTTELKSTDEFKDSETKQDDIGLLGLIQEIMCGVKKHLQGTWALVQADKALQCLFKHRHAKQQVSQAFQCSSHSFWDLGRSTANPSKVGDHEARTHGLDGYRSWVSEAQSVQESSHQCPKRVPSIASTQQRKCPRAFLGTITTRRIRKSSSISWASTSPK